MPAVTRVLVPIDFSPSSRAALEYATFLAGKLGAELDVLHVWEPPGYVVVSRASSDDGGERDRAGERMPARDACGCSPLRAPCRWYNAAPEASICPR